MIRSSLSTYTIAATPPQAKSSITVNSNQNHPGTLAAQTEKLGGAAGGGQLGGHTMSGG